MSSKFSAYLIGSDTLVIECCEHLLESGNAVMGLISDNPRVLAWARDHGVNPLSTDDYKEVLASTDFDYLFAITWLKILPDSVLQTPTRGTINFHDGPLPSYAGLNAPVWALLNGETDYGVTWHQVTAGVDEGDILLQQTFSIHPEETALSLNTRCFEVAMESFELLVAGMESDSHKPVSQDLSKRSYFGRYDRPNAACVLDMTQSAESLERLVRGLNFGQYANPVGSPKVNLDNSWYLVSGASLEAESPLRLAAGNGSLAITGLADLYGEAVAVEKLADASVSPIDEALQRVLSEMDSRLARHEATWADRLAHLEVLEAPFAKSALVSAGQFKFVDLPGEGESVLPGFMALLVRLQQGEGFDIGLVAECPAPAADLYAQIVPLRVNADRNVGFEQFAANFSAVLDKHKKQQTYLKDLVARTPALRGQAHHGFPVLLAPEGTTLPEDTGACLVLKALGPGRWQLGYDSERISDVDATRLTAYLTTLLEGADATSDATLGKLPLLPADERSTVLEALNRTEKTVDFDQPIHELIEHQAEVTPYATAVIFETEVINYVNLNSRSNQLARELIQRGIGPDSLVGVYVDRSLDMMICLLAVLKSGAAFVPMDPEFPHDRLEYIFENSGAELLLTQDHLADGAPVSEGTSILRVDADWQEVAEHAADNPGVSVSAEQLAYVIYTSGSTGQPKGVMVEHGQLLNFMAGMDDCIEGESGSWLAVTSLSFDISILELFWTLKQGMRLVIYKNETVPVDSIPLEVQNRRIDFDLFMWGSDGSTGDDKYRTMLDAAKFADENGFKAVWTPERHFNNWGGPYPNPAVTSAAIAAITSKIQIRAGSCVVPLHHPIRVAEDWAVVDNISGGRVGIAAASGWQPTDFVIRPEGFENNKEQLFLNLEKIQRLWRGETVEFAGVGGKATSVATMPRPLQKELPIWITSAGSVETFIRAGKLGANLLTHLLGQSVEQVGEKIAAYRDALVEAGHDPATRTVTVMLHALVGDDTNEVRELVREPLKDYLRGSISLLAENVWAFPTFRRPGDTTSSLDGVDIGSLDEEDVEAIVDFSFERYFNQSGLFGTPERCMAMVNKLKAIGVDEIGCLVDYGLPQDVIKTGLQKLAELLELANIQREDKQYGFRFEELVAQYDISHLQCTPSMARMLLMNEDTRSAFLRIQNLMIGGEAFPVDVANEITASHHGTLRNMYGPTETTIWSSTQEIKDKAETIPIGRPIANTVMYVLDEFLEPLPLGVAGDLYIGGLGVARGYRGREDLTTERFLANPFVAGGRIYKTGDVARWREDGVLEYLGRSDFQVKIRGFRIELGEIETCLQQHEAVAACVVNAADFGDQDTRLVAYVVPASSKTLPEDSLRAHLKNKLPEYMVPANFIVIDFVPQTPNGKVDRKALPKPGATILSSAEVVAPENNLESELLTIWEEELALTNLSVDVPFFDVGGNSLLLVAVHRRVKKIAERAVSLTDLYRFPTIRTLARFLSGEMDSVGADTGSKRAAARKERLSKRRGKTKK